MSFAKCVGHGPYVYVAFSSALNAWALENDRPFWFKIGLSKGNRDRVRSLNRPNYNSRTRTRGRPCLNFTDWRAVGCWNTRDGAAAEKKVHTFFKNRFGAPLDWRRLVGADGPMNGESEIYSIPISDIPAVADIFRKAKANDPLTEEIVTAVFRHIRLIIEDELLPGLAIPDGAAASAEADFEDYRDEEFEVVDEDEDDAEQDVSDDEDERRTFLEERRAEADLRAQFLDNDLTDGWPYGDEDRPPDDSGRTDRRAETGWPR